MLPINFLNLNNVPAFRSVQVRDGLVARQDRLPASERLDLPEIQESYRVSFSDAAKAGEAMVLRDNPLPAAGEMTRLYREIAAL